MCLIPLCHLRKRDEAELGIFLLIGSWSRLCGDEMSLYLEDESQARSGSSLTRLIPTLTYHRPQVRTSAGVDIIYSV